MKPEPAYDRSWFRLGLAASLAAGLLAVYPDLWLFRYPTKVGSVHITYNLSAIVLLVLWMLFAMRLNWLRGAARSVAIGLLGGYLAYFPAATVAEYVFRDSFEFVLGDAALIARVPAAIVVLIVTPLLCGTFLLGGLFGLVVSFRRNHEANR